MKTGNFELLLFLTKQTTCWAVTGGLVICHVHKSINHLGQRIETKGFTIFCSITCGYCGAYLCLKQPIWWPAALLGKETGKSSSSVFNASTAGWNPSDCTSGTQYKEKEHCVHLGWFHLLHPESKCWPRQDLYPAGIMCSLCLSCTFCMLCPKQRKPIFSSLDFELLLPWVWIKNLLLPYFNLLLCLFVFQVTA